MRIKYLIVGGGIAGLYSAYKIHEKFRTSDIMIIEKNNRIGGKIYTYPINNNTNIELGAGILHSDNVNVLNLLKELKLDDKLFCKDKINKNYWKFNNKNSVKKINIDESNFRHSINFLKRYKKNNERNNNISKNTLYELIKQTLGEKTAIEMNEIHGYDGDFVNQNASDGIDMLDRDYNSKICFLKGGLSQITNKLKMYLESVGINIYTKTKLSDIINTDNLYHSTIKQLDKIYNVVSENIILAIPKNNLMKIPFLNNMSDLLNSVNIKPLFRIYLIFPLKNNMVWFNDVENTSTNTIIRQIIPINKEKGIIMLYVSDMNAIYLHNMYMNKTMDFKLYLIDKLGQIFNRSIPYPTHMYVKFWEEATHTWKPYINSSYYSNIICNPYKNFFIVGESYAPKYQQWIEGPLITVNNMINIM